MNKKTFWMLRELTKGWYQWCHKHHCHKSQCISKYLFPWKRFSFERKFNNKFNNLIIATKIPRTQIKDSRYSEAATEGHINSLEFFVKISEKYLWKSSFLPMLQANSFLCISQGFYWQRFSWQNYRAIILKKTFSIRALPVAAFVYVNNFPKKQKK